MQSNAKESWKDQAGTCWLIGSGRFVPDQVTLPFSTDRNTNKADRFGRRITVPPLH